MSPGLNYEQLLSGWYLERKQQLEQSLAATVQNGDMVTGKSVTYNFIRDWGLWLLQLIPSWKHWLELGPRADGPAFYTHSEGMPFMPEFGGGRCFPQTYCTSLGHDVNVQFTDDVIFESGKIFQLVVLLSGLHEMDIALQDLEGIDQTKLRLAGDAVFFIPRTAGSHHSAPKQTDQLRIFRAATGDEFAHSQLCTDRPIPRGYDETLMWKSIGKRYVIVRMDRFVFAACNTQAELITILARLAELFGN